MNHKTLRRRAKAASKRSSIFNQDLLFLERMTVHTTFEKARLDRARKEWHKASQFSSRLQRRLAKVTKADFTPKLTRSGFKMRYMVLRILKQKGAAAAASFLGVN